MRNRYRKLVSAQRAAAEVPEHFTGTGEWHLVNYKRMASKCRLMFGQSTFRKHDEARYDQFLEECEKEALLPPEERTKNGKRVSAGVLLPHKLVERAKSLEQKEDSPISSAVSEVNLQWLRLVQDTQASGKLPSALAVCDVSGSMYGEPMEVAVALSLLLCDVADEPWRNKICTFSRELQSLSPCPVLPPTTWPSAHAASRGCSGT